MGAVTKLLKEIYVEPPYAFNPGLSEERLMETAEELVKIFEAGERGERDFDVAPSVDIEKLVVSQATGDQLSSGKLPPDCPVTGRKGGNDFSGKQAIQAPGSRAICGKIGRP